MAIDVSRAGIGRRMLLKAASAMAITAPLSSLSPVSVSPLSSMNPYKLCYGALAGTVVKALPVGPGKVVALGAEHFA